MSEEEKEFKKEVDETLTSIYSKINEDEKIFLSYLVNRFNIMCERNYKAIEYCNEQIQECKEQQDTDEWECCIEELQGVLKKLEVEDV